MDTPRLGRCAKRHVICTIGWWKQGQYQAAVGANLCRNPQEVCPRLPGEGYEKCHTVCQTIGHAEEVALGLLLAQGWDPKDADRCSAEIVGHNCICHACGSLLQEAGVSYIAIYPRTA